MTDVCEHGGLRRQCEVCELRAEVARLKSKPRITLAFDSFLDDATVSRLEKVLSAHHAQELIAEYETVAWLLREALAPFAAYDPPELREESYNFELLRSQSGTVTVGDFRRAREALEATKCAT